MQSMNVSKGDTFYVPENLEPGEGYYQGVLQNEAAKNYGHHITWGPNSHFNRNAQTSPGIFGATTGSYNDTVFNWTTYNADGYQFSGGIHALDNADSTEILSAPRLTTMNNQNAVIRMVTEKYYPTDWDEAELETVSTNGSSVPVFTPSIPQFGGATEEGIALQVRPRVEEDNYTIFLEMTPVIQEFIGWTDYSYSIPLGDNGELYPNTLKMPIIEARYLNTNVMSYDGETVVLGGVIRDELSMIEDQYPILGDLPLIGRFFQGKGKGSKHRRYGEAQGSVALDQQHEHATRTDEQTGKDGKGNEKTGMEDLESGAAGAFWIGKLPFGTYYLHETSVPSGYKALETTNDNWFILTVNKDGAGYLAADADEGTKPNNKINAEASKP